MLRFLVALIALATLSVACAPGLYPPDAGTLPSALFDATNVDRSANGLPPLAWTATLGINAQQYAQHMADTGVFEHQDLYDLFDSPSYDAYTALAENILNTSGTSVTGETMEKAFMASSPHRANILNPFYRYVGVGIAVSPSGRTYVAVEFGG